MHEEVAYGRHLNAYVGRSGSRKYYPAVSVGAEYLNIMEIGHHHSISNSSDFHPMLLRELVERLGALNGYSRNHPLCSNRVGHCAENYAASRLLREIDPGEELTQADLLKGLKFTKAFRPRTWKSIEWCANCHTMFD